MLEETSRGTTERISETDPVMKAMYEEFKELDD